MLKNARVVGAAYPPDKYHAIEAGRERGKPGFKQSSSSLRLFGGCPSRWVTPFPTEDGKIAFYGDDLDTAATRWGNLFDTFVLTPELFASRYVVLPPDAPKRPSSRQRDAKKKSPETCEAIDFWDSFDEIHAGKETISEWEHQEVAWAAKRFFDFEDCFGTITARQYIANCLKQVYIEAEWHCPETGLVIPTKCLVDLLPDDKSELFLLDFLFAKSAGDVKTACDANPYKFERDAHGRGYEIQAAWNTDHIMLAYQRPIDTFYLRIVENVPPFQPAHMAMSLDPIEHTGDIDYGRIQYEALMGTYCRCLKTGKWPGHNDNDVDRGCTIIRPNPYQQQRAQFAPKVDFGEVEAEHQSEESDTITP